jgi:NAD(P)-dependent dehydrogenase (short-subunit alcohol dehydrogenase family)
VLVLAADVCDVESVRGVVKSVIQRFGKLDILIANAGAISVFTPSKDHTQTAPPIFFFSLPRDLLFISLKELNTKDANAWWNSFEVNIRGAFNFIRYQNSSSLRS